MASNPTPAWLHNLVAAARQDMDTRQPTTTGARSAVLLLFGSGAHGPDIVLIQRSAGLRNHPGQIAFPGGTADSPNETAVQTALREAAEEIGLDPTGVAVVGELSPRFIPASGFLVSPVVAWWESPSPVQPMDLAEVSRVVRVPIADLANPDHRFKMQHPSGRIGPAFAIGDMVIWGFTASLIDDVLQLGDWGR